MTDRGKDRIGLWNEKSVLLLSLAYADLAQMPGLRLILFSISINLTALVLVLSLGAMRAILALTAAFLIFILEKVKFFPFRRLKRGDVHRNFRLVLLRICFFLQSLGLGLPRFKRSLWIFGETTDRFEKASPVLQHLGEKAPQYRLIFTAKRPDMVERLRTKYVDDFACPVPRNFPGAVGRYFKRIRPFLIVFLDSENNIGPGILRQAALSGIPILAGKAGQTDGKETVLKAIEHLKKLRPDISDEPRVLQSWRLPTWREMAGQSRLWKACARHFMRRRIDDWDSLRARLGNPQSVLCLGNGPTSEDPRLRKIGFDCLLRVNWRWKRRGFLTEPDMVFVGDAATLVKLKPRLFGFWNIAQEYGLILRFLVTHGPKLMEYITMERISPIIGGVDWPARPSNGALMLVAGAALQPERLIIAGIDLFLHPGGRYPGDDRSLNQYSSVHSRSVDTAIIRQAFKEYKGELIILSDALRQALFAPESERREAERIREEGTSRPSKPRRSSRPSPSF
jgi:hypothetical protein